MSEDDGIARAIARKLVALNGWMKSEPLKPTLERIPVLKAAGDKAMQMQYDAHAEQRRREAQDLELQAIRQKREAVERAIQASREPKDLGDIDGPAVRQPIQMEREFSNDADKAAYIEQVRRAMENAGKASK